MNLSQLHKKLDKPWLINLNRTNLGMNRFSRGAITRITATIPDPIMLVVTQIIPQQEHQS